MTCTILGPSVAVICMLTCHPTFSQQYNDMVAKLETTCYEINRYYNGRVCLRMMPAPYNAQNPYLRIDMEVVDGRLGLAQGIPSDPGWILAQGTPSDPGWIKVDKALSN